MVTQKGCERPDNLPSQVWVSVPDSSETHWHIEFVPDSMTILHALTKGYPQIVPRWYSQEVHTTQPPPSAPATSLATASGTHCASNLLPPHPNCEPTPTTFAVKKERFDADFWKDALEKNFWLLQMM